MGSVSAMRAARPSDISASSAGRCTASTAAGRLKSVCGMKRPCDRRLTWSKPRRLTILGSTVRHPVEHLETFPAPAGCTKVRFTCEEVTSMCPVTEQPDLSTVVIEYQPGERCVESKSLKLYLWSFRDAAVFAEQMAVDVAGDHLVHRVSDQIHLLLGRPVGD